MKRGRLITFVILCAMFLLSGCGAKKIPDVTITVKVPSMQMESLVRTDIQNAQKFMEFAAEKFRESYTDAKVSVQIEVFDYVDENMSILGCYGTENAVDVLYEGYFNMAAYVSSGHVVPLNDIVTEEIRADISESSWEQSTKNGNIYMMPYLSFQNIIIYNKQLLADCGLEKYFSDGEVIQNWSIEDWDIILDTLAEKLPEGSYPMFMYAANNQGDTHIMSLLRAFGSNIFDENGKFDFESEESLRALHWIQDGVERGWYVPHPENMEMIDNQQLFQEGRMAFYVFNNANMTLYDDIKENYGFVNFPGNIATSFISGFEVFDNGDEDKVRVAKDFVKYIYENEELLELSAGNLPESRKVADKYADDIEMLTEFTGNAVNVIDFMNSSPNWQGSDNSVRSVFWTHIHALLEGTVTPEECAAALNRDCNAAISVETVLHE